MRRRRRGTPSRRVRRRLRSRAGGEDARRALRCRPSRCARRRRSRLRRAGRATRRAPRAERGRPGAAVSRRCSTAPVAGSKRVDGTTRAGGRDPACDVDHPAERRDAGVPQAGGEACRERRRACLGTRGSRGVSRARVAADDVRLVPTRRRRGRRAARRGCRPARAAAVRGDPDDRVARDRLSAAQEVDGLADEHGRGVVGRERQRADPLEVLRRSGRIWVEDEPPTSPPSDEHPAAAERDGREPRDRRGSVPTAVDGQRRPRRLPGRARGRGDDRVAGRRSSPSGLLEVAGRRGRRRRCGRTARRSACVRGSITITRSL